MGCCSGNTNGLGPFSQGKELVEFVYRAHGGGLRSQRIPGGGLHCFCQGCGAGFVLETFVGSCPACSGVHAVSPPRCADPANIQFAGLGFRLPEE